MKLYAFVAAATLALSAPVAAADLPSSVPASIPAQPVMNWSGFYVGAFVGYGFSGQVYGDVAGLDEAGVRPKPEGFLGGLSIGYNAQFGNIVAGIEADIAFTDINDTRSVADPIGTLTASVSLDYLATVRGRIGFALDNVLIYGTGGLAIGQADAAVGANVFGIGTVGFSERQTHVGYALGAGVEWALNRNFTVRGEYLYYDLGKERYFESLGGADLGLRGSIVRAGISYRF